jgi:hypothetical protein
VETIKVISHLDKPIYGRFDGENYAFVPEKATVLSLEAATHIFGLGVEDKRQALNMLGLLKPDDNYAEALKKLDQLTFLEGKVTFEDEAAPQPETPARAQNRGTTPPRQ